MGPPEWEAGPHQQGPANAEVSTPITSTSKPITTRCYAQGWRNGFAYGFRDAPRLAARRLPVDCQLVLDQIVDEYNLAGGSDE
jgi:hypothetical protein